MTDNHLHAKVSRRSLLRGAALGLGGLGTAGLFAHGGLFAGEPAVASAPITGLQPHHAPKAKSLIWLMWGGGPSQFDWITYKPELTKNAGKSLDLGGGKTGKIIAPEVSFKQHGESGLWVSELFPGFASVADELCVIESMKCDNAGHPGAFKQMLTGYDGKPMPSLASWIVYGRGAANPNLPASVNLMGGSGSSGFLPASTQGVSLDLQAKPPSDGSLSTTRRMLDAIGEHNQMFGVNYDFADVLSARTAAGELGYRMITAAPEAIDLSKESQATRDLYGIDEPENFGGKSSLEVPVLNIGGHKKEYAERCLMARRLVERGVRVVTMELGGRRGWDHHNHVKAGMTINAKVVDRAIGGLIADLKQRGLLQTTIVAIGGEFGRTPFLQGTLGRDHYPRAYTWVVAGGGFKRGFVYGQSDELGKEVVGDKVHVTDLHATLMWQLGLDHKRLAYKVGGTDVLPGERFTQVHHGMLA
ncbi:hypothetical protein LBMAG53_21550 [Planctomycetota bacterium]|nr:hypothetical protein LBMAG53_21550 [Planctomycetota bacterium]